MSFIWHRKGFRFAISKASGRDCRIDRDLIRGEERVLVQCKNWRDTKVAAKEIREFFGVLMSDTPPAGSL